MIYFRDKYGTSIDTSFFLRNGREISSLNQFMIGDRVSIIWEISTEMAESMLAMYDPFFTPWHREISGRVEWTVHIPFKVIDRSHGIGRIDGEPGTFRDLGLSITLEAENRLWEDLWRWINCGDRPSWAQERTDE